MTEEYIDKLQDCLDMLCNTVRKQAIEHLEESLRKELEAMRDLERFLGLEVEEDITAFAERVALTYTLVYKTDNTNRSIGVKLVPKSDLNITKED